MNSKTKTILFSALIFGGGLVVGGSVFSAMMNRKLSELEDKINVKRVLYQTSVNAGSRIGFQPTVDFEIASAKSIDAVVFITTKMGDKSGISQFFSMPDKSSGSGVIISKDGYIITNNHVIDGSENVRVTLNDNSEYSAEVIATDPNTDLAVLKIEANDLPTLVFANSNEVKIGQWVLAVGNPFNLNSTVTAGIVSAKARNIGVIGGEGNSNFDYSIESFIQTDAAVNPGNSGGALVNLNGELIGINTAIATETGNYAGYSFAIPANLVKKIITDLIEFGVVQRGFVGVSIRDVDANMVKRMGLKSKKGAYIISLTPNGAAKEAGLEENDVITTVQNRIIRSASELQEEIANYRPGDKISIMYLRGDQEQSTQLTLRNINGSTRLLNKSTQEKKPRALAYLGASFGELSSEELKKFDISYGIKIKGLKKGGKLDKVGMEENFIITKVDKKPIESFNHFLEMLNNSNESIYIEGIKSNGKRAYYTIKKETE